MVCSDPWENEEYHRAAALKGGEEDGSAKHLGYHYIYNADTSFCSGACLRLPFYFVALSVVGTQRLAESGYFRAKIAQEKLINESSIPYSIVQATQFFEFLRAWRTFPWLATRYICFMCFSNRWLPTM